MSAHPVAYIRRSVSRRNDPGDVSRQFQTDKVRQLAGDDGPTLTIIDQDWGRSAAGEKTDKRLAFLGLLDSVERGEVSTLYAYSADRLARSVRWSAQLLDACEAAGTTIVTGEGQFAPGDDMARQMFHFQAMQNEGTLRQMTTKARSSVKTRSDRGDSLGRPPYGYTMARAMGRVIHILDPSQPIQPVLDAFHEAGSFNGAAKLLNERGLPAPRGRSWAGNVVARIIRREAPAELAGRRIQPRVRVRGSFILSRLLHCPCGQVMTGRRNDHQRGAHHYEYVSYLCFRGRHEPDHGRYIVSEKSLLPAVKAEVTRLHIGADAVEIGGTDEQRITELEAKRDRWIEQYGEGLIDKAKRDEKLAEVAEELDKIEVRGRIVTIPDVNWDAPPGKINDVLTILFDHIELDPETFQPANFVWTIPEWRGS